MILPTSFKQRSMIM